jgi:hypothetical protein
MTRYKLSCNLTAPTEKGLCVRKKHRLNITKASMWTLIWFLVKLTENFVLTLNKINIEARKMSRAMNERERDSCLVLLLIFKPIHFFPHFEDLKYWGEEKFWGGSESQENWEIFSLLKMWRNIFLVYFLTENYLNFLSYIRSRSSLSFALAK